jgi:hypothetical protein
MVDPQPTRRRNASAIWQFQQTGLAVDASIGVFNDVVMLDRQILTPYVRPRGRLDRRRIQFNPGLSEWSFDD